MLRQFCICNIIHLQVISTPGPSVYADSKTWLMYSLHPELLRPQQRLEVPPMRLASQLGRQYRLAEEPGSSPPLALREGLRDPRRDPRMRKLTNIRYDFLGRWRHAGDDVRLRRPLRTLARYVRGLGFHGLVVGPAAHGSFDGADDGETLSQGGVLEYELEAVVEPPAVLLPEGDGEREAPAVSQRSQCGIERYREAATCLSSIASEGTARLTSLTARRTSHSTARRATLVPCSSRKASW